MLTQTNYVCHIHCRLDVILGRSGSKKPDVYESKISLASRIVKVERQVRAHISKQSRICNTYQIASLHSS